MQHPAWTLRQSLATLALTLSLALTANAQWTVISLHPPGHNEASEATGVGVGQQVGFTRIGTGRNWHAILWTGSASSWVDLNPSWSLISQAHGAGDGKQVGYTFGPFGVDHVRRASMWSGSAESCVVLNPGGPLDSEAYAVSGGQQVGYLGKGASLWHGTAASRVNLHPGDPLNPYQIYPLSCAYGVGDGQQVGIVVAADGPGEPMIERASMWTGSAASWVSLHPAGAARSVAWGAGDGQQVGYAVLGDGRIRASLWSGSAASWVDLSPAGSGSSVALGVSDGQQVGYVFVGDQGRASLWSGTSASWTDLHAFLPAKYTTSEARAIVRNETGGTFIVGNAWNTQTLRVEAMMWVLQPVDSDNDGLTNADEATYGTDPNDSDSDDDGLLDGTEVDMAQGTGCPSPMDPDSDADGLLDGAEVSLGTSPCNPDTDGDGLWDSADPTPLVPGAPSSWIEEALRDSAAEVLGLPLGLIQAPNGNAAAGRRNAMSSKLAGAANKAADGDLFGAIEELQDLLEKLDGDPAPPDWMVDGPEKESMQASIVLFITLLGIP